MAVFKCKMCGANLEISENQSVATCDYCGTQQTLPKVDDEKKIALFNRANNLRIKSEFDKAAGIYESITAEFPEESEAFWGLVLCKYGIEYVDDKDGKKIPTCHRTLPTPIMNDSDFQQACENADISAKAIYREEAKAIDGIQKKILEIAATEEPYDIFICYKETDDATGARTEDSSIAQDIYTALTEKGYKVFYARNTLKKVAGTEYEPYIYAALSSAKIMLAIGTKFDYYDAVWVKNEWSRFISMMADDTTKILIPCYKNMDAYDIPDAFSNMQALDMNDVTFFNNLEASMERILPKEKTVVKETVVVNNDTSADVTPLLKRAFMFLEDGDFARADEFCEKVLNIDPECAEAYLGKLMVELGIKKRESLKNAEKPFDNKNAYQKIVRYGNTELKTELDGYIEYIKDRNEKARLEGIYQQAKANMKKASIASLTEAITLLKSIGEYKDSAELIEKCNVEKEVVRKDKIYNDAVSKMGGSDISDYEEAIRLFESIPYWKNAEVKKQVCLNAIKEIEEKLENEAKERVRKAEEDAKKAEEARQLAEAKAKRKKLSIAIVSVIVVFAIVFAVVLGVFIIPNSKYNKAIALMEQGKYEEAYNLFIEAGDYKDAFAKAEEIRLLKNIEQIKNAKVGDYITFGAYEQDDKTSNGPEEIEWLVLDIQDGKALLVSKYALDCKPYNDEKESVTWKKCTLRKWLNSDFMNTAFSADEKSMIPTLTVTVQDKVFLLSPNDVNEYFGSDGERQCKPTDYAVKNGAFNKGDGYCNWWLLSGGITSSSTAYVSTDGGVYRSGGVDIDNFAVRPAMWIEIG